MKKLLYLLVFILFISLSWTSKKNNSSEFIYGNPEIASINALAFGPNGVLFVGDSKLSTVFAIETKDNQQVDKASPVEIKNIDQKIADVLGTDVEDINIQDLAVNPVSKNLYIAVQISDGTPVLLRIENGEIGAVDLKQIGYSKIALNNVPAEDAKDQRGRSLRAWAISDLNYDAGKVMVSGLSNQEFSSTFRSIAYPFDNKQDFASLEIYHAAHGRYETYAPIKTFTTATINNKDYLVASYTCTPLVLFPLDDLTEGKHIKGRTVAEFGNGNTPLDMINMEKEGKNYLIMANSNRAVMKVKYDDIANYSEELTTPVEERSATAGVDFISFPMVNVLQLDKLDDSQFVLIQRRNNGSLDLWTANDRWL